MTQTQKQSDLTPVGTPTDIQSEQFKFLAIRDWNKLQPKIKDEPQPWLRDYTDLDNDPEYSKLTMAQRYLFSGCLRLRARFGRNLPNDHVWVARALGISPKERTCIPHNIHVLTTIGLLVLCNEQGPSLDKIRKEESRAEKTRQDKSGEQNSASVPCGGSNPSGSLSTETDRVGIGRSFTQSAEKVGDPDSPDSSIGKSFTADPSPSAVSEQRNSFVVRLASGKELPVERTSDGYLVNGFLVPSNSTAGDKGGCLGLYNIRHPEECAECQDNYFAWGAGLLTDEAYERRGCCQSAVWAGEEEDSDFLGFIHEDKFIPFDIDSDRITLKQWIALNEEQKKTQAALRANWEHRVEAGSANGF